MLVGLSARKLKQLALLPDHPLLVSMSAREFEFSGFPYVTHTHNSQPVRSRPVERSDSRGGPTPRE